MLPSALSAFTYAGQVFGLPLTVAPAAVMWHPKTFAAAGLQPPAPDWTLRDFLTVCAALQGLVESGRVAGLRCVLPPFVGTGVVRFTGSTPSAMPVFGAFGLYAQDFLWAAFVQGFGGTLFRDGAFDLTTPAAVEGIDQLTRIAREFGGPTRLLNHNYDAQTAMVQPATGYAMRFGIHSLFARAFDTGPADPWSLAKYRWAAFPRLPVRDVIPANFQGVEAAYHPRPPMAPQGGMTRDDLGALARFLLWLYEAPQQSALRSVGLAPVTADAATQDAFWLQPPHGTRMDWRRFTDYRQGWLGTPTPKTMFDALSAIVADPHTLRPQVAQATAALNAWLADRRRLAAAYVTT